LNDIIESKKTIKRRLGVEGLSVGPIKKEEHMMVIKSYSESTTDELMKKVAADVISTENQAEFAVPTGIGFGVLNRGSDQKSTSGPKSNRISDAFLKNHYN
jgi:hypothetical protein